MLIDARVDLLNLAMQLYASLRGVQLNHVGNQEHGPDLSMYASKREELVRHRVSGVGKEGVQTARNQIPVKIRSKSLEIMCFKTYKAYPDRVEKANFSETLVK